MERADRNPGSPLIALTLGDPAGIGREITVPAAREVAERLGLARIVILGPGGLRPSDVPEVPDGARAGAAPLAWIDTGGVAHPPLGEVQASCGAAALAALRRGHELALAGEVDALVTGPVNKAALHAAGERVEGQTELLGRWCGTASEMIGMAGRLRVLLATRHMPLAAAIASLTTELIEDRIRVLDGALRGLGIGAPRIAVAGLNPHAGEGGLLGSEDDAIVAPAVRRAAEAGIDAHGPVSPDTVFAQGAAGEWDGVVALYHDQAFIPLKLLGEGQGVTLLARMPYLRFSPMHGTAFDIVGQIGTDGAPLASPANLVRALVVASGGAAPGAE